MKPKRRKSIKQRKDYRDVPLSKGLRDQCRAFQIFAKRIDKAATAALKYGHLNSAGWLFYSVNDALEDLAKSTSYPSAHEIFDAAQGALGHAIYRAQNKSELYQQGHALPFIMYGPTVGGRRTRKEEREAVLSWGKRFCTSEFFHYDKQTKPIGNRKAVTVSEYHARDVDGGGDDPRPCRC